LRRRFGSPKPPRDGGIAGSGERGGSPFRPGITGRTGIGDRPAGAPVEAAAA
jgi:hypothetical protein